VVFGVLAALLAMLPVGGTALVWVPAAIWLFFDGRWGFGDLHGGLGRDAVAARQCAAPLLISGRAPISALVVFIGVLGGIAAFGAIGVIAGPVVLSLVLALIEFAEEGRPHALASTIRALMDVSHLLDTLNDAQRQAVASPLAPRSCWPAPAAARRAFWCTASPG
jgi:predicted PurR-regulated permease PerM